MFGIKPNKSAETRFAQILPFQIHLYASKHYFSAHLTVRHALKKIIVLIIKMNLLVIAEKELMDLAYGLKIISNINANKRVVIILFKEMIKLNVNRLLIVFLMDKNVLKKMNASITVH